MTKEECFEKQLEIAQRIQQAAIMEQFLQENPEVETRRVIDPFVEYAAVPLEVVQGFIRLWEDTEMAQILLQYGKPGNA